MKTFLRSKHMIHLYINKLSKTVKQEVVVHIKKIKIKQCQLEMDAGIVLIPGSKASNRD